MVLKPGLIRLRHLLQMEKGNRQGTDSVEGYGPYLRVAEKRMDVKSETLSRHLSFAAITFGGNEKLEQETVLKQKTLLFDVSRSHFT
jgi:hypothetical protein